jgi:hypothetical protein
MLIARRLIVGDDAIVIPANRSVKSSEVRPCSPDNRSWFPAGDLRGVVCEADLGPRAAIPCEVAAGAAAVGDCTSSRARQRGKTCVTGELATWDIAGEGTTLEELLR